MNTEMVKLDSSSIEALARSDLDTFASLCIPDTIQYQFPSFYKQVWAILITLTYYLRYRPEELPDIIQQIGPAYVYRFLLGLPRGHAKTTLIKLFVIYCLIYDLVDFPIIFCATEPLAYNFLSDVNDILCSSNIREIYGSWSESLRKDSASIKRGAFNGKDKIIVAVGANTGVRGLNLGNDRPDMIIMDDMQTKDNANSETEQRQLLEHLVGTVFKMRNMKKALLLYVGNMYNSTCILHKFKENPLWISLITGGILHDGTALWEELIPKDVLLEEYETDASMDMAHIWFAEIQNDPVGGRKTLLPDGHLPEEIEYEDSEILGAFITIDPAGYKPDSDSNVICVHRMLTDNRLVCPHIEVMQGMHATPEAVIRKTLELAIDFRCSAIFPEAVAYQASLAFWINYFIELFNLQSTLIVEPLAATKKSKTYRIINYFTLVNQGLSHIQGTKNRTLATFQALSFDFDRTNNRDDILDCLAMGELVRSKHLHLVHVAEEVPQYANHGVVTHNTPLDLFSRRV